MFETDLDKSHVRSSCLTKDRCVVIVLGVLFAPNAFAYLDPGTGSIIIQGLIAGIAMAGVTIRMYWHKVRSMFGGADRESVIEDSVDQGADANSD